MSPTVCNVVVSGILLYKPQINAGGVTRQINNAKEHSQGCRIGIRIASKSWEHYKNDARLSMRATTPSLQSTLPKSAGRKWSITSSWLWYISIYSNVIKQTWPAWNTSNWSHITTIFRPGHRQTSHKHSQVHIAKTIMHSKDGISEEQQNTNNMHKVNNWDMSHQDIFHWFIIHLTWEKEFPNMVLNSQEARPFEANCYVMITGVVHQFH